jgi:hypothetical protein
MEFVETMVPVFDPWTSTLYFHGKKMALKQLPGLDAV